jgi:surface antigen
MNGKAMTLGIAGAGSVDRQDVGPSLVSPERQIKSMSGTKRLPGGERRKASQRNRAVQAAPRQVQIAWRAGDPVRWKDRTGLFRREVGDNEHAEIAIAERVYRVKLSELG